jgi:hypothetical protein
MGSVYIGLIAVAGFVFMAVQLPNLLRRQIRVLTSIACFVILVLTLVVTVVADDFQQVAIGLLVWFFGAIGLSGKWWYEVQEDVTAREERDLAPLLRSYVLPVSIRSAVDGFWQVRYRRRMFRDAWSRRYLIGTSQPLPRSLMDDETVTEIELAYREQDESASDGNG